MSEQDVPPPPLIALSGVLGAPRSVIVVRVVRFEVQRITRVDLKGVL
jgi:hypothetical protein